MGVIRVGVDSVLPRALWVETDQARTKRKKGGARGLAAEKSY